LPYDQLFTDVAGRYRGNLVCVKELRFTRPAQDQITRKIKKEIRGMKDIHHDNINPFIGATVENNRIRLVTEYCLKGGLQVNILKKKNNFFLLVLSYYFFSFVNSIGYSRK